MVIRTDYYITIVEKEIMKQVIQLNEMLDALNSDGYIALNILFDKGKSTVKTESEPIKISLSFVYFHQQSDYI